jgi:predicted homoserine dehydrogenase-like protein
MGEGMKMEGIRIGALGAGGFGLFALQQLTQIPGVEFVGIAATHREAAFCHGATIWNSRPSECRELAGA